MTPRLLAQLSWVFENEAVAAATGVGRRPPTDEQLAESDRLFAIAGELASRANEAGQRTGIAHAFGAFAVVLLSLVSGCIVGTGHLPILGHAELCAEVARRWEAHAIECGVEAKGDASQCDKAVGFSDADPAACFRALEELPCDQLKPKPQACQDLFL